MTGAAARAPAPPQRLTIDPRTSESDSAEAPPLGSWSRLYAIVVGELVLLILLFTLFARAFE